MSRTAKQAYSGSKRIDIACRNHGTCPYCHGNRTAAVTRQESAAVGLWRDYLQTTPASELLADWQAVEALNLHGPTLKQTPRLSRPFFS